VHVCVRVCVCVCVSARACLPCVQVFGVCVRSSVPDVHTQSSLWKKVSSAVLILWCIQQIAYCAGSNSELAK